MKKVKKLFVAGMIIFVLWGCTKKVIVKQIEFKIFSKGEVVSYSINDSEKIEIVLDLLDKCVNEENFKDISEKFDLPKSTTYEVIVKKDDEYVYKFVGGYVVYDSLVYGLDDYENVINKFKDLFII
ncbi:MAG: hypothetical protein ACLR9T_06070 [Thomasclavelia sp.]|uniref:hypothetical protein n=1 Tax=Thomasclavelia sp. TaxID=3025757 RepID=UPI0039A181DD